MTKKIILGAGAIILLAGVTLWAGLWAPMWPVKAHDHFDIAEYGLPAPDEAEKKLMVSAQKNPFSLKQLAELRTKKALEILDIDGASMTARADALVYAASGADLNPNAPQSWMALGMAYMAQGENRLAYEKAQEAFETALLLAPQEQAASYLLGQALFLQGQYYAARQTWLPILVLHGNSEMSLDIAAQIAQTYILSGDVEQGVEQAQAIYADNKGNASVLALRSLLELAQFRRAENEREDKTIPETYRIDFYDSSAFNLQETRAVWKKIGAPKNAVAYYTAMLDAALQANNKE